MQLSLVAKLHALFYLILLDVQSQRVLRGYHLLEIIGEQQNKRVNIIRDVFHRLYQGVLYSQNIVLFLVEYVIIFHTCYRHVAEFLFYIF